MANTRCVFYPEAARFPSTNFPQPLSVNGRPVLAFDASTAESCNWPFKAPQGMDGGWQAVITYFMASATSGKVDFTGAIEAVTPGDAVDLDTTDSFDTANTITAPTVPGTAGYLGSFTMTLSNLDSMAAGDECRFKLTRDAADGTNDTATGDCYIVSVELQDGL